MNVPFAQQKVRPGRAGYVIAALIFLLGGAASGFVLYDGIRGLTKGLVRATGPGSSPVTLDRSGTWTVFYEHQTVLDDGRAVVLTDTPSPLLVTLVSSDGNEIPMDSSTGEFSYSTGERAGRSIGSFGVDEAGDYTLEIDYPRDLGPPQVVLALGHEKGKATLRTVFGTIGLFASGFIAFVIAVLVFIMRWRSKNRLREAGIPV